MHMAESVQADGGVEATVKVAIEFPLGTGFHPYTIEWRPTKVRHREELKNAVLLLKDEGISFNVEHEETQEQYPRVFWYVDGSINYPR